MFCFVGKYWRIGNVVDGIKVWNICFIIFVDDNVVLVGFDVKCFKFKVFDVVLNIDGGNQVIGCDLGDFVVFVFDMGSYGICCFVDFGYFCFGDDFQVVFFQCFVCEFGDFCIFDWYDIGY